MDTEANKSITRKLDCRIVPIVMSLYFVNFLDRVNIGNSKLYGLEEDLALVGNQYQICVAVLFIPYCLLEVPSTLIIKKAKPNRFLAIIAVCWGLVATLSGLCKSYGSLVALRLAMGALESGLYPSLVIYLTTFYSRKQLAVRLGYVSIGSALSGAVGGIIAYGVGFLDGVSGLRAWRWLMIVEGIPSVIVGVLAYFVLPTTPESARFLNADERAKFAILRNEASGQTQDADEFHWADVKDGIRDWQIWIFALSGFTNNIMLYGFSTFLPTIIRNLGQWSTVESQAMTTPVHALGIGTYLIVAYFSDRNQHRGIYICSFGLLGITGFCLLIANHGPALSYTGCFLIDVAMFVMCTLTVAWLAGNKPRHGKRAFATGAFLTIANSAGIVAPFLYPNRDAPTFYTGYGVSIGCLSVSVSIHAFMSWYYTSVNRARAHGKEDWKLEGRTEAEIAEMGDWSPKFVYST
ncbi:MFS transporter [Whalleya microplaca]|nr:MFS transporter [Whalleya microplaca]